MKKTSLYMRKRANAPRTYLDLRKKVAARVDTGALNASQVVDLGVGYHGALQSVQLGTGTWDDANTLALACNIALLLAEQGLGPEYLPEIKDAQAAVTVMGERGEKSGSWFLDGQGLDAVQRLLAIHDSQLESPDCSPCLMQMVLAECKRRMARKQVISAVPA